jgi:hypothetical protein
LCIFFACPGFGPVLGLGLLHGGMFALAIALVGFGGGRDSGDEHCSAREQEELFHLLILD